MPFANEPIKKHFIGNVSEPLLADLLDSEHESDVPFHDGEDLDAPDFPFAEDVEVVEDRPLLDDGLLDPIVGRCASIHVAFGQLALRRAGQLELPFGHLHNAHPANYELRLVLLVVGVDCLDAPGVEGRHQQVLARRNQLHLAEGPRSSGLHHLNFGCLLVIANFPGRGHQLRGPPLNSREHIPDPLGFGGDAVDVGKIR